MIDRRKLIVKNTVGTLLAMLVSFFAFAQQGDPDSVSTQSKKWYGHPIIGSGPETGFLLGGGFFRALKEADSASRISFLTGALSASLKGYCAFNVSTRHFMSGENTLVEGDFSFANFPIRFYGIGNAIDSEVNELYYSKTLKVQFIVYKKSRKYLFLGAGYRYGNVFDIRIDENGIIDSLRPKGYHGHHFSGPQVGVLYDSRDNPLASAKGWFFRLNSGISLDQFGSSYQFSMHTLDVRTYFKPLQAKEDVLALQLFAVSTAGDVPFTQLAQMGGASVMRGYYTGQYRDYNLLAMQAEYRYHVNDWFGMVGFFGIGSVAHELSDITDHIKPSYGGGVRFILPASDHLSLRIDYGWGCNTGNLYIGLMEAF